MVTSYLKFVAGQSSGLAPVANDMGPFTFTEPTGTDGPFTLSTTQPYDATSSGPALDDTSVLLAPGGLSDTNADGTWTVNTSTGDITFAPADTFSGTATHNWTVDDINGVTSNQASIDFTYDPLLHVKLTPTRSQPAGPVTNTSAANMITAIEAASPGDVIVVADGTYSGGATTLNTSGNSGNPIYVYAQNEGGVVYAPTSGGNGITWNSDWIECDGVDFADAVGDAPIRFFGNDVIFRNCTFRPGNRYNFLATNGSTRCSFYNCDFLGGDATAGADVNACLYGTLSGEFFFYDCYIDKGNYGNGLHLQDCQGMFVYRCEFTNVGKGVYFSSPQNNPVGAFSGFHYEDNYSNCTGSFAPGARALAQDAGDGTNDIQLGSCVGANIKINRNVSIRTDGGTSSEDHFNIGSSGGTSGSPMEIHDNRINGGGPSTSSTGMIVGDGSGQWADIRRNILVRPGQVGIGMGGGYDHYAKDNIIWQPQDSWTNTAAFSYPWNGADGDRHTWEDMRTYFVRGVAPPGIGDVDGLYQNGGIPTVTEINCNWADTTLNGAGYQDNIINMYFDFN